MRCLRDTTEQVCRMLLRLHDQSFTAGVKAMGPPEPSDRLARKSIRDITRMSMVLARMIERAFVFVLITRAALIALGV